jgi:cytidine deaminase
MTQEGDGPSHRPGAAPRGPAEPGRVDELEARARAIQPRAHAPYSKFPVGAALRADGAIYEGVNVENASFPLTVCAERNAIAAAVCGGARRLEAVAVCSNASPPAAPCGGCRQVLLELADDPAQVPVVAINPQGERRAWTLAELIPHGFSGRELP